MLGLIVAQVLIWGSLIGLLMEAYDTGTHAIIVILAIILQVLIYTAN